MRVAFLTQWLEPEGRGLLGGIAQSLVEQGARVVVFTGDQVYGSLNKYSRGPLRGPLGGFSEVAGMPVVRHPTFASHDSSATRRFATYASFALSSLSSTWDLRKADVVLVHCSPPTAATAALASRAWGGPPVVLMIQDVWPDSVFATGFVNTGAARCLANASISAYVGQMYRRASAVTALSPGMRELLVSRGVDRDKVHVVYNWADEETVAGVVWPERRIDEPLHLMFAGNIGPGQNLSNVLRGLALVPPDQVRLTLVGDGADVPALRRLTKALELTNVTFIPRVPREQIPSLLSTAHLHLVSLADAEVFRIALPSKFQSLIAAGLPVLAVAPGEVGDLVRQHRAGVACPPDDPQALGRAIADAVAVDSPVLAEYGNNGARLYESEMSRAVNATRLYDVLSSVI